MTNDYLIKEYELCFEQLRFYDTRQVSFLSYLFSLTSAVATAQFAIYKLLNGPTKGFFFFQAFLSTIVFIATLLIFLSMLQNRLYFVYIARQINAIRSYLMDIEAPDFNNNQLYTSVNFQALKPTSIHTFQLLGATLISGMFAGLSAYSISSVTGGYNPISVTILVSIGTSLAEIVGGSIYLSVTGKNTADYTIHGKILTQD